MGAGLHVRFWALAGVLIVESLIPGSLPHPWFHVQQAMAAPIVFSAALLFVSRDNLRASALDDAPVRRLWLLLHAVALGCLVVSTFAMLRIGSSVLLVALWYMSIAALIVTLVAALLPVRRLLQIVVGLRAAWFYAALVTVAAMSARALVRWVWDAPNSTIGRALQQATFSGTRMVLGFFYAQVIALPARHVLGTPRFLVEIAGTCSGMEGLALVLIFTVAWLVFARSELRLARAALLVPIALVLSWLLNLVRIALLIAIGSAGHPEIAVNGFHSEAGWILFNAVAIGFLFAVQRWRWLRKDARGSTQAEAGRNVAAIYLLPFLAVLAASLLTHAVSSGFDWLYPVRPLMAVLVLWHFRAEFRRLDWRFSWLGLLAGVGVFALWLGLGRLQGQTNATADALAQLPGWQRIVWLMARCFAAVITVPVTEELAFRGYLARRMMSADVEAVSFRGLSVTAVVGSSIVFGLLHDRLWLAGIVAGVAFALVAKRRNRLGEALAAHATANLLLAAWVLARGEYGLW
jgi:exosortase E/protease (VPEID-CTERM system)